MYYTISTNQIAIVNFNKSSPLKLDWADGYIIEYLQKQTTSSFAKKNFIIKDNEIYFLLCYDNIIKQLPLLNIETKDAIGRRIKKLKTLEIINHYVDRKENNRVYFNTTDLFETFFSYDQTDDKPNALGLQTESLSVQKPFHMYDNNIKDNNIKDNKINIKENVKCKKILQVEDIKEDSIISRKETVENTTVEYVTKAENEFEELWRLYGRVGSRNEAIKSFIKARKTVSIDEIKEGMQRYFNYLASKKTATYEQNKRNFSTWLNQKGWNDENEIEKGKLKYSGIIINEEYFNHFNDL